MIPAETGERPSSGQLPLGEHFKLGGDWFGNGKFVAAFKIAVIPGTGLSFPNTLLGISSGIGGKTLAALDLTLSVFICC